MRKQEPDYNNQSKPNDFLYIRLKEEAGKQFDKIAEKLLNHYAFYTPKARYRFAEIEFYFYNNVSGDYEDSRISNFPNEYGIPYMWKDYYSFFVDGIPHQDSFTHCFADQGKNGYWYLHSNKKSLKQGRRKGIDLTIGNEEEFTYGGILIRAIQNVDNYNDYINGPSKVVDRIILDLNKTDILEITDVLSLSALAKENRIFIGTCDFKPEQIYSCQRHGLKINERQYPEIIAEQKIFIKKDYRYFIFPKKTHTGKEKVLGNWIETGKYSADRILPLFGRKTLSFMNKVFQIK